MEIPDHIPEGMAEAEVWRYLADLIRQTSTLDPRDIPSMLTSIADLCDYVANKIDPPTEGT